jgi:DNA topoisomerase-6 subunit B
MAKELREISIAEFFEKNRHLMGYQNPTRALLTVVKEAVDNSNDACQEAGILPTIKVWVRQIDTDRFRVVVEDNGPGVIPSKVPNTFAKFLFGSKFHRLMQSRGIFGLGIHGAVLYAQLTTGKPVKVTSSIGEAIHVHELMVDVVRNQPEVISHQVLPNPRGWHGIKIELELVGSYATGRHSIFEYLKRTAIANPYARIVYVGPDGRFEFKRKVNRLPRPPKRMRPHPYGTELGMLRRMLSLSKARNLSAFLQTEFCRIGNRSAQKICKLAGLEPKRRPCDLTPKEVERLHRALQQVKLRGPPADCLSPLGKLLLEGLKKEVRADFYTHVTRPPTVYRGFPFVVEVGLAYGGEISPASACRLYRFANLVPLLYDQGACVLTQAVKEVDWRRYGLSQSKNSLPAGPLMMAIHLASVWIPFVSEGKQAIADYPEILREIKLALQDAGRQLAKFIRRQKRAQRMRMKMSLFERYIPEVASSLAALTGRSRERILNKLKDMVRRGGEVDEGS